MIPSTFNRFRRRLMNGLALGAGGLWVSGSRAQGAWPAKPLSLIVPFPAGGASDIGGRILAVELNKLIGQSVVIDNLAGAGGAIGIQKLLRSAPDGHTLVYGGMSEAMLVPMVNKSLNYKTEDMMPVAMVGNTPVVLATRPDFPAKNIDELIALIRKRPGQFSYGSSGIGSFAHVMTETIKDKTGVFMVHIPYRGGAQVVADLVSGQIDVAVITMPSALSMLQSRKLKVLGVSSKERVPLIKDVPTFNESKELKGVEMMVWAVLFAPLGTPDSIVQKLNAAINQVHAVPAIQSTIARLGSEVPTAYSPTQLRDFLNLQKRLYASVVSRIQPE
jgi:tripartite-type tricarboxylate transporter receptor subunit TctC